MTFDEYNNRINAVVEDILGGAHAQIMTELALDALAMIKNRVIQYGLNPEGVSYADVITNTPKPHKDYTPQYKRFKSGLVKHRKDTKNTNKSNKYRGFVDFSFSTRMWANIKLVSSQDQLRKGIAKLSCTTTVEQAKLNKNTEQRGVILALSDYEKENLLAIYDEKILDIWRRHGL